MCAVIFMRLFSQRVGSSTRDGWRAGLYIYIYVYIYVYAILSFSGGLCQHTGVERDICQACVCMFLFCFVFLRPIQCDRWWVCNMPVN